MALDNGDDARLTLKFSARRKDQDRASQILESGPVGQYRGNIDLLNEGILTKGAPPIGAHGAKSAIFKNPGAVDKPVC